ncbi:ankyrin repeat-containing domain protein [Jimgerdemannia flammicorona]|uniref:Ankyrin repeat-containing domain protein n=1 Tax=Jimgerdemannia flammicorona TaxID=994334 RepID=A0A433QJG2_9FUNG|nr:ankyrin repeat-containing domain protein [Jimgerdemannia flammicorona]
MRAKPPLLFVSSHRLSDEDYKCLGSTPHINFGWNRLEAPSHPLPMNSSPLGRRSSSTDTDHHDRPVKRRDTSDRHPELSFGPSPALEQLEPGGTEALWASVNFDKVDMKFLFSYMRSAAPLNVCNPQGYGLLYFAARNKSMEALRLLMLQPDIRVSVRNGPHAESPLHAAAQTNLVDAIELFLEHGAPVNAPNSEGHTPLYNATYSRNIESMQMLLSSGAQPDTLDRESNTPLQIAVLQAFLEGMKLLIEHGARVDHCNNAGMTPLANAINLCHIDAMHLLLQHGADIHARTRNGRTLLHHAVNWNRMEAVEALVAAGCEIDVSGATDEETPIYMAVQQSKIDLVQFLLEHGADPCYSGACQRSRLAADYSSHPEEPENDVPKGATKPMGTNNLPLLYAANHGFSELCSLLVTDRTPDFLLQHAYQLAGRAKVGHETVRVLWECLTARKERDRRREREREAEKEAERLAKEVGVALDGDDEANEDFGTEHDATSGADVMGLDFVLEAAREGGTSGLDPTGATALVDNVAVHVVNNDVMTVADDDVGGITAFGIDLDPV